jgi:excisionase family DNA binding protein
MAKQAKQMEPELLNSRQAAELLGVSRKTLSLWVEEGRLRFVRVGTGHKRYRRRDLLEFVEALDS